jgi:hypothetical protein
LKIKEEDQDDDIGSTCREFGMKEKIRSSED